MGGEAWIQNTFALRAGYKTGHTNESWSVGAGLKHSMGGQSINIDVSSLDGRSVRGEPDPPFSRIRILRHTTPL